MPIDFTDKHLEEQHNGEDVTLYINDLGDLVIKPCQRRVRMLTPHWQEYCLTSAQVYAVVEDREEGALFRALDSLGAPQEAMKWMKCGCSVVFTCIALEMLDTYLFNYNGIQY
jgi:hypothetical protein